MIIAFFGTDTEQVRTEAHKVIALEEERGALRENVTVENFEVGMLRSVASAESLFGGKRIIVLDTLSGESDFFEEVLADIALLQDSSQLFVLIEGPLSAAEKKTVSTHAEKATEYKRSEGERFNTFLLADALLSRDRRTLWLHLMHAWREGQKDEELIGTLYWQLKMLRLAEVTKSAEEAGVKPFVFTKAKRALQKFPKGEALRLSRELLTIYHDGHAGKRDIDLALERWVLTI